MACFSLRASRLAPQSLRTSWPVLLCVTTLGWTISRASWAEDSFIPISVESEGALVAPPEVETPAPLPVSSNSQDATRDEPSARKNCCPKPRCAAEMTVRLNPLKNLDLYEELTPDDPLGDCPQTRQEVISWLNMPAYGQYIFIDHDPLLFEDIPAERYGEVFRPGVQPVVSLVKFVGAVPILPYKISMNHFAVKDYNAYYAYDHHGNLRPGVVEGAYLPDYYLGAPYPKSRLKAGMVQIGAATGVVFFLP